MVSVRFSPGLEYTGGGGIERPSVALRGRIHPVDPRVQGGTTRGANPCGGTREQAEKRKIRTTLWKKRVRNTRKTIFPLMAASSEAVQLLRGPDAKRYEALHEPYLAFLLRVGLSSIPTPKARILEFVQLTIEETNYRILWYHTRTPSNANEPPALDPTPDRDSQPYPGPALRATAHPRVVGVATLGAEFARRNGVGEDKRVENKVGERLKRGMNRNRREKRKGGEDKRKEWNEDRTRSKEPTSNFASNNPLTRPAHDAPAARSSILRTASCGDEFA
ncbi:hypothetical protein C8R45DRAFT_940330 [Mycena sanguinolenta]|nr:hypothetical protein C8R45DRAFT_940330 [Mycena sanguinolenta]